MKLFKTGSGILLQHEQNVFAVAGEWDHLVNIENLHAHLQSLIATASPVGDESWLHALPLQAPLGSQEIWAAGVTYLRSKEARMEESKLSGGADFTLKCMKQKGLNSFSSQRQVVVRVRVKLFISAAIPTGMCPNQSLPFLPIVMGKLWATPSATI